jgi:monoamine oxidase
LKPYVHPWQPSHLIKYMNGTFSKTENIIIVGGGVTGLMIARELLKEEYIVTILEASDRLGGRIHTIRGSSFDRPVEKGAEFIHGSLPLTIQLLKEAGIEYKPVRGTMNRSINGKWKTQDDFTLGWEELMRQMNEVREDVTMDEFLEKNFNDKKYEELRKSVLRFAQGFDLADTSKASVLSLREEWMGEEGEQFRIPEGFEQLISYLEKQCKELGCLIHTSTAVTKIQWQKNDVTVIASDDKIYNSNKIIVTVSLGVLQAESPVIIFQPGIDEYFKAAKKIGFGSVVKVLLQFKEAFWKEKKKNIGFLFANEMIPTWWTQLPSSYPLLTGWAGGPQAWPLEDKNDDAILEIALRSLSNVFKRPINELRELLTASAVANWINDRYSKGGYSYCTPESIKALKLFNTPIRNTIFFAGEAFYEGPSPGTVEAALVSAKNAVEKIMINE